MLPDPRLFSTFCVLLSEEVRPFHVRRDVLVDRGQPRYDARRGQCDLCAAHILQEQ
jgi:hypothetical protein